MATTEHSVRGRDAFLPGDLEVAQAGVRRRVGPPVIEFRGVSKVYDRGSVGLDQATFTDQGRRVRLPRRGDRLGQVDDHAPAHQGARALVGHDPGGGPRHRRGHAQAGPLLPAQPRRRLPGLQAAAQPDAVRQRRLRAPGHRRQPARDPREGPRHPAPDGPLDEAPQLPRPALRRRAAARLGRARVRQPPAAAAGRRADRQPRPRDVHRDHAAALPDQPHRHDRHRRHARPRDGRQDAPARDRAARGPRRARRGHGPLSAPATTSPPPSSPPGSGTNR